MKNQNFTILGGGYTSKEFIIECYTSLLALRDVKTNNNYTSKNIR